eukprot:TRINITY_DN114936_c0_g1_i1.p1 TRINITY_DN114936_c0_g1~~TRINITY_DN114936_c0_g1_i1.p1  ORF type:complete len:422 (+),score=85.25 TRINITY_DN114936_c0_g1_i1:59-1267(+)
MASDEGSDGTGGLVVPGAQKLRGKAFWESIGAPKYVCAPMVDQSELAFRMLCRRYGTTLAYTPMLHSRMFSTQPKYRKEQFTTCPEDRPLFAQFCGDDPDTLLSAAKLLPAGSADAVDLNCGCPQGIARKGHYGAFLLTEKDLLERIVRTLDQNLSVPVTVKIRKVNLENLQDTLNLASTLEAAGASVITLHGRTKEMKGQNTGVCDWDAIAALKRRLSIPVIANGGIQTWDDVERCLQYTGADAVMSSEALLENPSLFGGTFAEKRAPYQDELALEYMELAKLYSTPHKQVKAHLFHFLYAGLQFHTDLRAQLGSAKGLEELTAAASAVSVRRKEEREAGSTRPDSGWYLRYRRPLGENSKKRKATDANLQDDGGKAELTAETDQRCKSNGADTAKAENQS